MLPRPTSFEADAVVNGNAQLASVLSLAFLFTPQYRFEKIDGLALRSVERACSNVFANQHINCVT